MARSKPADPARRRSPTVEQARAFCHTAKAETYREAAKALGYEQHVAVIHLVARFTHAIGTTKLVSATPSGRVVLTDAGREALPAAQRMVEAADALAGRAERGVRFSSYPSITGQVVKRCPALLTDTPPLILSAVSEDARREGGIGLLRDLQSHALDIVIAPARLGGEGIVEHRVYRWTLRVLLPRGHPLRNRARVRPAELIGSVIAAAPPDHQSRRTLDAACLRDRVTLPISLESESQEMLRDLVDASPHHAAIVPDDAFGAPEKGLGPALVTEDRHVWGGAYALYRRIDQDRENARERLVAMTARRIRAAMAMRG